MDAFSARAFGAPADRTESSMRAVGNGAPRPATLSGPAGVCDATAVDRGNAMHRFADLALRRAGLRGIEKRLTGARQALTSHRQFDGARLVTALGEDVAEPKMSANVVTGEGVEA